jgi:hypothetical protein
MINFNMAKVNKLLKAETTVEVAFAPRNKDLRM